MRRSLPASLGTALVVGLLLVASLPVVAVPSLDEPTVSDTRSSVAQSSATTTASSPTAEPTTSTTAEPTSSPTPESTSSSTPTPTDSPTPTPTDSPTPTSTDSPTSTPTDSPTSTPTDSPTSTSNPTTSSTTQTQAPSDPNGGDDADDTDDDDDDDRRRGRGKARQLGDRLTTSIQATGAGEFRRAQRLVGTNYTQTLSTYESLSDKDGAVAAFAGAQSNQQTYIDIIREYEATRNQYRRATQRGNTSGTQKLSRKLTRLADASNQTAARLQQNYSRIERRTPVTLDAASSTVEAGQRWVAEQQAQIEPAELTRARLRASIDADRASFLSPATVDGTLRAANGSPIANQQVIFAVGGQRVATTTDGTGAFRFDYRPTRVAQSAERVTLEYVPTETAPYTRASTELSVQIEQATGEVAVSQAPSNAAFGDEVTVRGRVAAENVPAAAVPVEIRLGNTTLGTVDTAADGRFSLTTRLPASVSAGDRQLVAALALQERALTAESGQTGLSVAQTSTSLTLRVANASRQHVFVYGTLTTDDGTRVGGQQLQFSVDDTVVGTATTGSNGAYKTNLSLSPDVRDAVESGQLTVQAAYEADGGNLEASRDSATVPLQADGQAGGGLLGGLGGSNGLLVGAAGAAFLLLLLLAAWGILRFGAANLDDADDDDEAQATEDETSIDDERDGETTATTDAAAATSTGATASTATSETGNQFSWSDVGDGESERERDDAGPSSQQPVTFDDQRHGSSHETPDPDVAEDTATDTAQQVADARIALADGEFQTAVNRAYEAAREHVQTRYDFDAVDSLDASSSPEAFYETCLSHAEIDEETLTHLDELTKLQDKALYGYGSVSEQEAEEAVSHTTALTGDGTDASST
jgi:hypothetical protein